MSIKMNIHKNDNMNSLINEIIRERTHDKGFRIETLSKYTDNIIQEGTEITNMGYEVTAEILINIGAMYINEFIESE